MTDVPRVELAPDYSISQVINGCWQLTPDHGGGPATRKEQLQNFAALVERGFTTFDCADIYAGTESLLGEFRRTLADPDGIQVHTKFVPNRATLADLDDRSIDATIDRSRSRLGVDCLDLVQFHWWDYEVAGLDRMYERLLYAQSAGRIRLLGATNFNTTTWCKLMDKSPSIVTMQTQYSLLDRRPERNMVDYCSESGVSLLPYGVLAGGFLSEKYLGCAEPDVSNRSLQKYRLIIDEVGGWSELQNLLELLARIGRKHGVSIATVAARWVLDRPSTAAIILGVGSRSRAEQNSTLGELKLDADDREQLKRHLASQRVPEGDAYDLERDAESIHSRIIRTELQSPESSQ